MISVVFFDFSGTLVRGALDVPACRASVVHLLQSKGFIISLEQYSTAMESALYWRKARKRGESETAFEELETKALHLLDIHSTEGLVTLIEEVEFQHYKWQLFPRVREVLKCLSRQYRLAIISNSRSNSVIRVLKKEGLFDMFTAIVLSRDVGYRKPDPKIFQYALRTMEIQPGEALFVGDSFIQDVLGARNLGMKTIWLTDNRNCTLSPSCDAIAKNLFEIPRLLAELSKTSPLGEHQRNAAHLLAPSNAPLSPRA